MGIEGRASTGYTGWSPPAAGRRGRRLASGRV